MTSIKTNEYIFASVLKKAADERVVPGKTKSSREWFRQKALDYKNVNRDRLFNDAVLKNRPIPGKMYMYVYDAKTKDKLPYWDAFPLIFCVGIDSTGHSGINLHYLPPVLRARLMDALYTAINNNKYDNSTKIRISYNILKSASNMKYFKPCFKQYLSSHVKSQLIEVPAAEWDIALFLPTQNFQKATADQVWRDSATYDSSKGMKIKQATTKFKNRKRF